MSMRVYYLPPDGELQRDLTEDDIRRILQSREGLLWIDYTAPTVADGEFLENVFGFHHLAVEDCLSTRLHAPKIDDFSDHLFIVVHGIDHAAAQDIVRTTEMTLFLAPHFVVSTHSTPLYSIDSVRARTEDDARPLRRGADFLAHALIDSLIDNILPTIDRMAEVTEEVQEEAIDRPDQSTLDAILRLNRSALRIHRAIAPQREVVNRLARGEFPIISADAVIFYRDVYDHLVRIEDLNLTIRDEANGALTTYLSAVAIRQNETMKVLSAVASIFLPLTLVAGIYGMNFENMPELGWGWGYFGVLAFIGAAMLASLFWFWRAGWLTFGKRRAVPERRFSVEPAQLLGYSPEDNRDLGD